MAVRVVHLPEKIEIIDNEREMGAVPFRPELLLFEFIDKVSVIVEPSEPVRNGVPVKLRHKSIGIFFLSRENGPI